MKVTPLLDPVFPVFPVEIPALAVLRHLIWINGKQSRHAHDANSSHLLDQVFASMSYPVLLTLHLFGALIFIGVVFFEVLILEGARRYVDRDAMRQVERAIGQRARRLMPWVLLVLYSAGIALASYYREALAHPFASSFATLLSLKILLALSVLVHFIRAITWSVRSQMTSRRARFIHLSVFCHMIGIVLLAKAMFHVSW